jgi:hypothetical protein
VATERKASNSTTFRFPNASNQAAEASETLSELLAGAGFNEGVGSPQAARLLSMSNHAEAAARALEKISKVRVVTFREEGT